MTTPTAPVLETFHQETDPAHAYIPALDGLRALAVIAVLLFHGGVSWAHGGYLGVDLFFVLSGFLITRKLLDEQARHGTIHLRSFWAGRVRRLLPASLVVLIAVALYTARYAEPVARTGIRGDVWSALAYVANWRFIYGDVGYFASTAAPSPVRHLWSLSVEEQFYLLFPLLLVGLAAIGRVGARLVGPLLGLAAASTALTIYLQSNGASITRLYEGTDTRLATIVLGAVAAAHLHHRRDPSPWLRVLTPVAAVVAAAIALLAHGTDEWMYPGGQMLFAAACAVLIVSVDTRPTATGTALLASPPLVAVGVLSYSLYLWHWPLYLVLTPDRTGLDGTTLLVVRILSSLVAAYLSYRLVEDPIRRRSVKIASPTAFTVISVLLVASLVGLAARGAPRSTTEFQRRTGAQETLAAPPISIPPPLQVPAGIDAPDAAPTDRELRVALVGDSAGSSLDFYAPRFTGITYRGATTIGCGVMAPAGPTGRGLDPRCTDWERQWARGLGEDPDVVVVVLGAWEIVPHVLPDGTPYEPAGAATSAATTAYLDDRLETALTLVSSKTDARIAFLELACASVSSLGLGDETPPRGRPEVVGWFNDRLAALAARHPGLVQIISLNDRLCPDGEPVSTFDGLTLREDGTHWSEESAPLAWRWLLPLIQEVAYRPIG